LSENKLWCPIFTPTFRAHLIWWAKKNRSKVNRILDLVEAVCQQPFQGIGKPEPLKYFEPNTWSRRIDLEHRLVYRIKDERIYFLQCRYHYE
jgi:toxin YoeB